MSRIGELTKNTLVITIGRVSTQFVSFLLLPLYTALLSTDQYGTVDLIITLVQLFIPIISLMIDQGVFRYLLNCNGDQEKNSIVSNAFFMLTALSTCFLVLYGFIACFFNLNYKIWLLLILIATAYSNLFLQIARGLRQTGDYALGSFICSAVTIVLNVVCIAFIKMGAVGMLIATFLGNVVCCLFLFGKLGLYKYISVGSIDKNIAIDELKYSVPLVPNQLSVWVMNSSNRIIVSFVLGTAANGILAVSQKFPAIFMTFFNIFLLAWHETGAIHYYDDDRDKFFTETLEKIITIFSTLCMGIMVILPLVFNWFVNDTYNDAYYNIPIYMAAALFNVIVGLLGVVYVATKKTFEIAKTTLIASLINICVNLILIKSVGLYAASISTFIGYLITMVYRIVDTKKYLKISYNIKQYIIVGAGVIVCTFIYYLKNKIISCVFFPIFIMLALCVNRNTLKDVCKFIKSKIGAK